MIFKSVEHALKWSFQVSNTSIVNISSINSMRGSSGSGEMTQHDKHAQAALIISMADRLLDMSEMAWVLAKYGDGLTKGDYSQRDGKNERLAQSRAIEDQLTKMVIQSLPTGVHSRRGYAKLVRCYFGQQIGVHSIRTDLKCAMANVATHRHAVYDVMDAVWRRAHPKLEDQMREQGLILVEVMYG